MVKTQERGEPAWNLTQGVFRQVNFRKMTCRSEGTENAFSYN